MIVTNSLYEISLYLPQIYRTSVGDVCTKLTNKQKLLWLLNTFVGNHSDVSQDAKSGRKP